MDEIQGKIDELNVKAENYLFHFHAFGQDTLDALGYVKCLQRIEQLKERMNKMK